MINIPISIGELFDRISILEIKLEKIQNKEKLKKSLGKFYEMTRRNL